MISVAISNLTSVLHKLFASDPVLLAVHSFIHSSFISLFPPEVNERESSVEIRGDKRKDVR